MMEWQPIILATVGSLTLITSNQTAEIPAQQEIQQAQNSPAEVVEAAYPNRIEIAVNISAHEDLKIAQDMTIAKGQIISDRIPEKTRLQAQKKQLELSLERVLSASIQEPPKPLPVPAVAPLHQSIIWNLKQPLNELTSRSPFLQKRSQLKCRR